MHTCDIALSKRCINPQVKLDTSGGIIDVREQQHSWDTKVRYLSICLFDRSTSANFSCKDFLFGFS